MSLRYFVASFLGVITIFISACAGDSSGGNDFASKGPASPEPPYYGTPTDYSGQAVVQVSIPAKFLYRKLDFTPPVDSTDGLGAVVNAAQAAPIPFAEFHIYNSSGTRIQQGETTTDGIANFSIPSTTGSYTLKVFSRANNLYLKARILEDIYTNTPYSISKEFTLDTNDVSAGSKDLSASPVYAEADETKSAKIEGGAFNIMFDILIANEYIRRNIGKNGSTPNQPSSNTNIWWVAESVAVYWKAGFNPYTYFGGTAGLSFYSPDNGKLYILGGDQGDVKTADTDHFDDSIILHEYAHFLEDKYGHTDSPGGSHTGNFVIDARLAWSEGWANYFQAAVLTGAEANDESPGNTPEDRLPTNKRFQYYVDTYGYLGSGHAGVNISFNLAADGTSPAELDNVASDLPGTGIFREVSVARTLYKSTRNISSVYSGAKTGAGVLFENVWKVFAGEDTNNHNKSNPLQYSLVNVTTFPLPNSGLFNWLVHIQSGSPASWPMDSILTEEKQGRNTRDYAYFLPTTPATCAGVSFNGGAREVQMSTYDPARHSHQQMNNDFYLYRHDGNNATLSMTYTVSGNAPDLDLILYKNSYVYFEDDYWYAGQTTPHIAKLGRTSGTTTESISLNGLAAGTYILNVKINAHDKTSAQMNGTSTYKLYKDGEQLCGTEQL